MRPSVSRPKCVEPPFPSPATSLEGKGRQSTKELTQFLFVARGSLLEVETQSMLKRWDISKNRILQISRPEPPRLAGF
jgi:hypothetical protein